MRNLIYRSTGLLVIVSFILVFYGVFGKPKNDPIVGWSKLNGTANMPLVMDTDPITASLDLGEPIEQRGPEFRRYLAASVRISHSNTAGSGTIIYYDSEQNWAYVASCGHLWNGSRSASELKAKPSKSEITVWYHNDKKLDSPRKYSAEVLFWNNERGYDSSLLRFKPDWEPEFFPIAPKDYNYVTGSRQHSLGCDAAREVAHYDVEIVGIRGGDLVTQYNSPRPGRSGGGLMSETGFYIATCWGTSAIDGSGIGYFTPLSSIRTVFTKNGYQWLLDMSFRARKLPIVDHRNPQKKYPQDYIPVPEQPIFIVP